MKIEIRRDSLVGAMRLAGMVIVERSPKPVLACVRLVADGGKVWFHGTNLETSVMCEVSQAVVEEPGVVLMRSSLFSSIINTSKSEALVIRSTENGCEVVEADAKYELLGIDPAQYPIYPKDDSAFDATMPLEEFRLGVRRTEFAAAKEASRYAIQGVFLKQGMGQARLVATDGRRLACCQMKDEADMEAKGIVPPKAMKVLSAIVDYEGSIKVKVRASQAWFECGPLSMVTNLMAGTFPDYEKVIPSDCPVKLTLSTAATLAAIRQVTVMKPDDTDGIVLSLAPNRLVFEVRDGKKVVGAAAVPVEYGGDPMEMQFRPEFITDALRVIGAETFGLELKSPGTPGLIRGPQDYAYVFMPISMS